MLKETFGGTFPYQTVGNTQNHEVIEVKCPICVYCLAGDNSWALPIALATHRLNFLRSITPDVLQGRPIT
jgi:predicted phosphohydrolase